MLNDMDISLKTIREQQYAANNHYRYSWNRNHFLRERERESFVRGLIRKQAYRLKLIMYLNMSKLFFCNVSAAAGVHKNRRGCAICTSAAYSSFSCSWRSRTWHCKTLKSPSTLFGNHQFDTDPLWHSCSRNAKALLANTSVSSNVVR